MGGVLSSGTAVTQSAISLIVCDSQQYPSWSATQSTISLMATNSNHVTNNKVQELILHDHSIYVHEIISISNAQTVTHQHICFQNVSTRCDPKILVQT
jgi:hypothetical protein